MNKPLVLVVTATVLFGCGESSTREIGNQLAWDDPTPVPTIEVAHDAWNQVPEWRFNDTPVVVIGDTIDPVNPTFWDASDAAFLSDQHQWSPTGGR